METIVRLLPRIILLGVAGAALLILAEYAQEAHAQAPAPPGVANGPPDLPPGHASAVPEQLTTASLVPPTAPAIAAAPPIALSAPPITLSAPPMLPAVPDLPVLPAVPELRSLPDLPTAPGLPDLPTAPGLPDLPAVPVPSDAPFHAPSAPTDAPTPASVPSTDAWGMPAGLDIDVVAARAAPNETPPARDACPDGSTPQSTDAEQAGFLSSGVDDANPGAQSFDAARSSASALPRDPLLRPD
jgi:hypothetical protein